MIHQLDTSFETDRVLRLVPERSGFRLVEEAVEPPFSKTYPVHDVESETGKHLVAERDGVVIGFLSAAIQTWNRRASIHHLYVDRSFRSAGVGMALIEAIETWARDSGARELWVETQNVNTPAIGFYRRIGFRLTGLDETMYDPTEIPGEVAIFLSKEIRPVTSRKTTRGSGQAWLR